MLSVPGLCVSIDVEQELWEKWLHWSAKLRLENGGDQYMYLCCVKIWLAWSVARWIYSDERMLIIVENRALVFCTSPSRLPSQVSVTKPKPPVQQCVWCQLSNISLYRLFSFCCQWFGSFIVSFYVLYMYFRNKLVYFSPLLLLSQLKGFGVKWWSWFLAQGLFNIIFVFNRFSLMLYHHELSIAGTA